MDRLPLERQRRETFIDPGPKPPRAHKPHRLSNRMRLTGNRGWLEAAGTITLVKSSTPSHITSIPELQNAAQMLAWVDLCFHQTV